MKKIIFCAALACLIASACQANWFAETWENWKQQRQERAKIKRLNKIARKGPKALTKYINTEVKSNFLKKLFKKTWIENMIKTRMRYNQKTVMNQIKTMINRSQESLSRRKALATEYEQKFLEIHYNIVGKEFQQGLVKQEATIISEFLQIDPHVYDIEKIAIAKAVKAEIKKIITQTNQFKEYPKHRSNYIAFIKKASTEYESFRNQVLAQINQKSIRPSFRALTSILLDVIDRQFYTRRKRNTQLTMRRTRRKILQAIYKQITKTKAYRKLKSRRNRKILRKMMYRYIPLLLVDRYILQKLAPKLITLTKNDTVNKLFLSIELETDFQRYSQHFNDLLYGLQYELTPDAEKWRIREEQKLEWHQRKSIESYEEMMRQRYLQPTHFWQRRP